MSPPGGIADPAPSAGFLSTGKIDVVPPGISQMMQAGNQNKSTKRSPLQLLKMERAMMPQTSQPLAWHHEQEELIFLILIN